MRPSPLSLEAVDAQEERFAAAFASGDMATATPLYQPDVVYISPTTRLFGWPARIVGLDQALEFIQLTIAGLSDISYAVDERALIPGGDAAYVRVQFDFSMGAVRLRSTYVVVYRYRDALIAQQELYYDPSGQLEVLSSS
ncbi:MAG TPA: nuclear transport factor 2 family protein [Acidimicrobiales bacterium]|nr:nuclear transport factor 2 family protein [Acidimicrobiales bacterium]